MITDPEQTFQPRQLRQPRPDGSFKCREVMEPSDQVRRIHERMLRFLYSLDIPMPYATGGVPGRQLIDNVSPHRENTYFYMVDLQDAFQGVDVDRLLAIAKSPLIPRRYESEVESFILDWATTPQAEGLPLGAPCSPYLFNLYCLPMDRELGLMCERMGLTYTRYLDDLTFSSKHKMRDDRRRILRETIERLSGIGINQRKSRLHTLTNGPVTITGVSLQPDGRMQPSPHLLDTARQVFDEAIAATDSGRRLTDEEIGRMHGWNGVLRQLVAAETPTLRTLNAKYRRAMGKAGIKAHEYHAEASGQLILFDPS